MIYTIRKINCYTLNELKLRPRYFLLNKMHSLNFKRYIYIGLVKTCLTMA